MKTGNYPRARYKTGEDVCIGDHVRFRVWAELWLKERVGRVVYVPGISKPSSSLEYDGLKWASVEFEGTKFAPVIDPNTGVMRGMKFLRRTDDDLVETPEGYIFPDDYSDNIDPQQTEQ